ncbi:hypothetical protein [Ornithinibacillus halotolerans]|uniref:Nucleotide kinase n=1 Tax=Ornithinibacillus halotolerans TaxID=1274357 RepID=A0A916RTP5_9BACI|nr:hypothetical protein [Ornithinibacillus halotolerans]GGA67026.1 hypothetical protein GCM10008025_08550 [Ornithinibacillus halotolerans]
MPNKLGFYVTGNTAEGFVNFLSTNTSNFHHHIILKHPSLKVKTTIIKEIINQYEATNDLEVLYSSIGNEFLEGVIIRDKKIAIIDERIASADLPGSFEVDLTLFTNDHLLTEDFSAERDKIRELTETAYKNFQTGLRIHDDLEKVYIKEMNFKLANQVAEEFVDTILKDVPKQNRQSQIVHRLFGTNTKDGVVNCVPEILSQLSNKYFIKGRAGTGKSTFMKKVMAACQDKGYDIELYHCSFDPNSIDMVLVRDLEFCIFDSTDPHEFFPEGPGDYVIDMYEKTVTPGTDEKYEKEITELNTRYKSYMKKGVANLKEAGEIIDSLEQRFVRNPKEIEKIKTFLVGKILDED